MFCWFYKNTASAWNFTLDFKPKSINTTWFKIQFVYFLHTCWKIFEYFGTGLATTAVHPLWFAMKIKTRLKKFLRVEIKIVVYLFLFFFLPLRYRSNVNISFFRGMYAIYAADFHLSSFNIYYFHFIFHLSIDGLQSLNVWIEKATESISIGIKKLKHFFGTGASVCFDILSEEFGGSWIISSKKKYKIIVNNKLQNV